MRKAEQARVTAWRLRILRWAADEFESIEQVQLLTDEWLRTYNEERPHDSLGRVPPLTFLPRPNRPVEPGYRVST